MEENSYAKIETVKGVIISKINSKTRYTRNPLGDIETDAVLKDYDVDSLDIVEIVMECERIFGVRIPDEKLDGIATVEEICNLF